MRINQYDRNEIRHAHRQGISTRQLMEEYKTSRTTIRNIAISQDEADYQRQRKDAFAQSMARRHRRESTPLRDEPRRVTMDPVSGITADGDGHCDRSGHEMEAKGL